MTKPLRPGVVRVADRFGDTPDRAGAHIGDGAVDAEVRGVRFRCGGQVDNGFSKRETALGHADELHGICCRHSDDQCLGVGETDVFGRADDYPPGDEPRVLPRFNHPG